MIGLLLKDLYTMRQYGKSLLIMLAFFTVLSVGMDNPAAFFEGFIILMCMMMTINSFSYDALAKWDRYALSLPITRNEFVGEKYLLSIILCLFGAVISLLVSTVFLVFRPAEGYGMAEHLTVTAGIICTALFFTGILLPLIFRFGVEKSRIFMIAVFATPTAAVIALDSIGLQMPQEATMLGLLKLLPVVALLFYLISYLLSVRIMQTKEI